MSTLEIRTGHPTVNELPLFKVGGKRDIFVTGASGDKPTRLTSDQADDFSPRWSRDGRWIYFASNRSGEYQVWKVPAAGGEAVRVTRKGGFVALESPDSQWVYYTKTLVASGLWRVPREGGRDPSARIGRRGGLCHR